MKRYAEAMKTPYNPFNVKIKNVCVDCKRILHEKIINYQIICLIEKKRCILCGHLTINQPYQKICSMCSKIINFCCMCVKKHKEDPTPRPQMFLFTEEICHKYPGLTKQNRRYFMKITKEKWKAYVESKQSICEIKQYLTHLLRYLVYQEMSPPKVPDPP